MSNDFRFVEKLANAPWMCVPEHVEFMYSIFLNYVDRSAKGQPLDVRAVEQATGTKLENTRQVTIRDGVARIPIEGTIMRRASLFTAMSGGVSTAAIMQDFLAAYNNNTVESILFVIDSPGGEAHGIAELASVIREKRDEGDKRIEAYCDGMCASAAYWIASATHKISTDPIGALGSIGVVTRVRNPQAVKDRGELEFWNSRSPLKRLDPTTKTGKETIQAYVDDLGDQFIEAVAENRGVKAETVEHEYGGGFVLTGRAAVAAGVADALATEEEVISRLAARGRSLVALPAAAAGDRARAVISTNTANANGLSNGSWSQGLEGRMDLKAQEKTQEKPVVEEQEARGLLSRLGDMLGVSAQAVVDDDAGAKGPVGEENGIEMTEEQTLEATQEGDALSAEEREELARLRAEREHREAERERMEAQIRANAVDKLLDGYADIQKDGRAYVMPSHVRNAAQTLVERFGDEAVTMSSDGVSATFADTKEGRALSNLLKPWQPVELGERGTVEGAAQTGGTMGDHEMILATMQDRGLDGAQAYEQVASELAAKGQIRKEA